METRANYVAIGLFVLVIIASAFGALFWLYRAGQSNVTATMRIVFPEAITGLSTGGSVLFNGIRVGEVTRLEFPPEGGDNVIAVTRVDPNAPIKVNTEAQLASQGLTGVSYISLTGGTGESLFAAEAADGDEEVPTLYAKQSTFTNVVDNLQSVLGRLDSTLNEVNLLVSENRPNINGIVGNVRDITGELAQAAPQVSGLVADVASASRALAEATPQVASVVDRVNGILGAVEPARVASIVENADTFVAELPQLGTQAREIAGTATGIVTRLQDGADRLGEALTNVRDVTAQVAPEAIASIVADVGQTTRLFATKGQQIGTLVDNASAISGDVRRVTETVATRTDAVARAIDDASSLIGDARAAVQAAAPAIEGVGRAVGAIDPARITGIVNDVEQVTAMLANEAPNVADLIASAQAAARSVRGVTEVIAARNAAIERTLDNGAALVADLRAAAQRAPELVATAERLVASTDRVVAAIDADTINAIVRDAGQLADVLAAKAQDFGRIVDSVGGISARGEAIASAFAQRMPQVGAAIDNVAAASASVRDVAAGLPALAERLEPGVANVAAVMEAVDPAAVRGIVEDVRGLTGTVARQAPVLERVLRQTDSLTADAGAVAANARSLTDDVVGKRAEILAAVDDARAAVASVREATAGLPELVETLRPGVENASNALAAIDPAAVREIVDGARGLVSRVASEAEGIGAMVRAASGTATRVEAIVSALAQRTPQIGAAIDNVEAATAAARRAAESAPALVATLQPGVENFAAALSAVDPASIEAIVGQARELATTLGAQRPAIERVVASIDGTAQRVEAITSAVAQRTPQIGAALDDAAATAAAARRAAEQAPALIDTIRPGVENFGNVLAAVDPAAIRTIVEDVQGLANRVAAEGPRISGIVANVEAAVGDVRAVVGDVRDQVPTLNAAVGDARAAIADVRRVTERLPGVMERLEPGLAALSDALQSIDPAQVATILTNVSDVSTTFAASRDEITRLVAAASSTAQRADEIVGTVQGKMDVVTGAIDDVGRFAREVGAAAPDIDTVVASVTDAATTLRDAVRAVDPEAVRSIVADLRATTSAIGSRAGQIGSAIDNVFASARDLAEGLGSVNGEGQLKEVLEGARNIVRNLDAASGKIGTLVDRANLALGQQLDDAYAGFNAATGAVERLAAAIEPRAGEITDGLARFSKGGLDDLRAVLTQARSTLSSIESAVSSFDRNPSRVIFGGEDAPTYSPKRR